MLGQLAVSILLTLALNPVTRVTSTLSLTDIEKPGKILTLLTHKVICAPDLLSHS